MLRKASLVFFTALSVFNVDLFYVWPCVLVLICFTFAHIHYKPFVLQRLNHFEALSLITSVLVYLVNLLGFYSLHFSVFLHLVYFVFSAVLYCRFSKSLSQEMVKATAVPESVNPSDPSDHSGHKLPEAPDYLPIGSVPVGAKDVVIHPQPPTDHEPMSPTEPEPEPGPSV